MFSFNPLFLLALVIGGVGVYQMVEGTRAIRRSDFMTMSRHHLVGVVLLTLSSVATAVDVGDGSYLLMQAPFIIGALRPYLVQHPRSSLVFLRSLVGWWSLRVSIVVNIALVVFGLVFGLVAGISPTIQVVGAGIVSSGLCVADERRQTRLLVLALGRTLLCFSSVAKLYSTPDNGAALVWTILMGWATWESVRAFLAVRAQKPP